MDNAMDASKSAAPIHGVVDHSVETPARRSICFADEEDKFAPFAAQDVDEDEGEPTSDEDEADCDDCGSSKDATDEEEQEADGAASTPSRRVQFCDEQSDARAPSSPNPRFAATAASAQSSRSPLLKKFSPLQDRRVNAVLIEALQLVDLSSTELAVIGKAVKRLRDAIHGFALLVDKQVNIIGVESLEERGRVRADIMDLCASLKTSNALLESTSARMKKALSTGKNQIHAHKRKLLGCAVQDIVSASSPAKGSCSSASSGSKRAPAGSPLSLRVPSSPYALSLDAPVSPASPLPGNKSSALFSTAKSPTRVPFASLLRGRSAGEEASDGYRSIDTPLLPPDAYAAVLASVGLAESEFLDLKEVTRVLHEALAVLVARSSSLTFLGKAHHRKLLPKYSAELAQLVLADLHVLPQATPSSPVVVPASTLFDYMSAPPLRFDALLRLVCVSNSFIGGSRSSPSTSPTKHSPGAFFRPPAFMSSAAKAAADTFGVNPFAEQLTRNGGLVNGGRVVSLVVGQPAEPELLESAGQTLNMAKLLHELATAECEARTGDRMSLRAPDTRAKAFSRAYIAASKQLLEKEAVGGFA